MTANIPAPNHPLRNTTIGSGNKKTSTKKVSQADKEKSARMEAIKFDMLYPDEKDVFE